MTSISLVKFPEASDLTGYGFDIIADRVVRFNKHADGTYQNTRATYSINKKQFTHYDIRKAALSLKSEVSTTGKKINFSWKWIVGAIVLAFIFSASECSFNVNTDVTVQEAQD